MGIVNPEKRCKASHSEFKEIWPGLKRCMVCGFALATDDSKERSDESGKKNKPKYPKEDALHSTYHGKFYKAKNQYGYSNVLDYKTLKAKEEGLLESLKQIKKNDILNEYSRFIEFFTTMISALNEVDAWVGSFDYDGSNSVVQNFTDGVKEGITKLKALCEKGLNAKDVFEAIPISEEILPIYREMFNNIQSVLSVKTSKVAKDYDDIDMPVFSFDIDSLYDSFELFMQIIPTKQNKVNGILNDLYTVEFTRSLRLWDMCKAHPRFEHYAVLLWNSPKFLSFIAPYMTESQFKTYVEKNRANRQLIDFRFKEAPFYFGRVALSESCDKVKKDESLKGSDKECKGDCEQCPFGYIDLGYMDKLAEFSDEEDDTSDGYENSAEYKQFADAMTAIGKLMYE